MTVSYDKYWKNLAMKKILVSSCHDKYLQMLSLTNIDEILLWHRLETFIYDKYWHYHAMANTNNIFSFQIQTTSCHGLWRLQFSCSLRPLGLSSNPWCLSMNPGQKLLKFRYYAIPKNHELHWNKSADKLTSIWKNFHKNKTR